MDFCFLYALDGGVKSRPKEILPFSSPSVLPSSFINFLILYIRLLDFATPRFFLFFFFPFSVASPFNNTLKSLKIYPRGDKIFPRFFRDSKRAWRRKASMGGLDPFGSGEGDYARGGVEVEKAGRNNYRNAGARNPAVTSPPTQIHQPKDKGNFT